MGFVPSETYDLMYCDRSRIYGIRHWRYLFSARQLLCHGLGVEIYREMLAVDESGGSLAKIRAAAYVYLALPLDTVLNYGNRSCRWDSVTERMRSIFDRHDFGFCWSYAEMAPLITGAGYEWAMDKTLKCIGELSGLIRGEGGNGRSNVPTLTALIPASTY
jgi:putative DNA methylase